MRDRSNSRSKINLGSLYVILSAICFSIAGVVIKLLPFSSMTINGLRSILCATVILIYLKLDGRKLVINKIVILGAICNTLVNMLFVFATKLTTAANAIVLQFTMPIFLLIYTIVIFKKKPKNGELLTCFIVFIGIVFFFLDSLTKEGLLGNICAIISGSLYAFMFLIKKVKGADFESSIILSALFSFLIGIPFYLKETEYTLPNISLIVLLGVVQMGIAYVLLSKGLDKVPPITAGITSTIEPILNPLLVMIINPEPLGIYSIIGMVVVIVTITLFNIKSAIDS